MSIKNTSSWVCTTKPILRFGKWPKHDFGELHLYWEQALLVEHKIGWFSLELHQNKFKWDMVYLVCEWDLSQLNTGSKQQTQNCPNLSGTSMKKTSRTKFCGKLQFFPLHKSVNQEGLITCTIFFVKINQFQALPRKK